MIFELVGPPEVLYSFEELVRPYGVKELVRTGRIGLAARPRPPAPGHAARPPLDAKKGTLMAQFTAKATPSCWTARWPLSATAARGTRTRSTCVTPAWRCEVGLRAGSQSWEKAEAAGLTVREIADAVRGAHLVAILLPDHVQQGVFEAEVEPNLEPGAAILFAHGFTIHFGQIAPAAGHDVIMVAPKGPGHRVREVFEAGRGHARRSSLSRRMRAATLATWRSPTAPRSAAGAQACSRRRSRRRPKRDLFGEQAVLCGGVTALMQAGFETLVEAGYQPEIAYYECINEMKLIVDLIYEGGFSYMRYSISDVAEYGDLTRGPVMVDDHVRATMRKLLEDIRSGSFARELIAEEEAGRPRLQGAPQTGCGAPGRGGRARAPEPHAAGRNPGA